MFTTPERRDPDFMRLWIGTDWNVLTATTLAGVPMPSVDAANRHFPLTIAAEAAADPGPFTLAVEADCWFAAAEGPGHGAVRGRSRK